jgi:amidase
VRVGVVRDFHDPRRDAAVEASFATALRWLEKAGVVLVDPVEAALSDETEQAELAILIAEFRGDLDAYLATVERGPRSLDELIAFNSARAGEVMPHFGQELLIAARDDVGPSAPSYVAALEIVAAARSTLAELLSERDLDALVAPVSGRAWRTSYEQGDVLGVYSSSLAAVTGYPSIAVPVALADELPLGIALIAGPDQESLLVMLASALELERGPFPEPRFLPSIGD